MAYSNFEKNAKRFAITQPRFEYNATRSPKTIQLDGAYVDVKGKMYSGSVTLAPYTSVILNKANNSAPVAKAGADLAISLPVNQVTLNASASYDVDNNIVSYKWTKVSGPTSYTFSDRYTRTPVVSDRTQGTYTFTLLVTDKMGATSMDTVKVTVQPEVATMSQSQITGSFSPKAETEQNTAVLTKEVKPALGLSLYPNPVVDYVTVSTTEGGNGNVTLILSNAAGNILSSRTVVKNGGLSERLNVHALVPGVYYLQVKYPDGTSATRPFIKH